MSRRSRLQRATPVSPSPQGQRLPPAPGAHTGLQLLRRPSPNLCIARGPPRTAVYTRSLYFLAMHRTPPSTNTPLTRLSRPHLTRGRTARTRSTTSRSLLLRLAHRTLARSAPVHTGHARFVSTLHSQQPQVPNHRHPKSASVPPRQVVSPPICCSSPPDLAAAALPFLHPALTSRGRRSPNPLRA